MEVGVRVEAENPRTGERRHTNSAYLTMVAVDEDGQPIGGARALIRDRRGARPRGRRPGATTQPLGRARGDTQEACIDACSPLSLCALGPRALRRPPAHAASVSVNVPPCASEQSKYGAVLPGRSDASRPLPASRTRSRSHPPRRSDQLPAATHVHRLRRRRSTRGRAAPRSTTTRPPARATTRRRGRRGRRRRHDRGPRHASAAGRATTR